MEIILVCKMFPTYVPQITPYLVQARLIFIFKYSFMLDYVLRYALFTRPGIDPLGTYIRTQPYIRSYILAIEVNERGTGLGSYHWDLGELLEHRWNWSSSHLSHLTAG